MNENLMGYEELAKLLGVKKGTLYAWVCRNEIPHVRISGRLVRFSPTVIQKWVTERMVTPAANNRIYMKGLANWRNKIINQPAGFDFGSSLAPYFFWRILASCSDNPISGPDPKDRRT